MAARFLSNPVIEDSTSPSRRWPPTANPPDGARCRGWCCFPGSNCELDALEAVRALGADAEVLWHGDATVAGVDAVVVPCGFAHGDALRPEPSPASRR